MSFKTVLILSTMYFSSVHVHVLSLHIHFVYMYGTKMYISLDDIPSTKLVVLNPRVQPSIVRIPGLPFLCLL